MEITATFHIRRYWFKKDTPEGTLDRLNLRYGQFKVSQNFYITAPYVDVNYYGDGDPAITRIELLYSDWIASREAITYHVSGDDGL